MVRCPDFIGVLCFHKIPYAVYLGVYFVDIVEQNRFKGFGWFRGTKIPAAVMAHDHMLELKGGLIRKILDIFQFFVHHLKPDHNMTQQSSFIRIVDAESVFIFSNFAKIMENYLFLILMEIF